MVIGFIVTFCFWALHLWDLCEFNLISQLTYLCKLGLLLVEVYLYILSIPLSGILQPYFKVPLFLLSRDYLIRE